MICGDEKFGNCNRKDWFARMLSTFIESKTAPSPESCQINAFYLVPVDFLSKMIVCGALHALNSSNNDIFFNISNMSNKRGVEYKEIASSLSSNFVDQIKFFEKYSDWFQFVVSDHSSPLFPVRSMFSKTLAGTSKDVDMKSSFFLLDSYNQFHSDSPIKCPEIDSNYITKFIKFLSK